jgi:acylphosphatase
MSDSHATIARLVHYAGQVQGVGFRFTTVRIAHSHAVTGWVRNLADGRVALYAEGAAAEVERFLQAVRDYWQGYVTDEQVEERAPTGSHAGFAIVR